MALPSSGPITTSQINVELSKSSTAQIGLNDSNARALAQVPSGTIAMSNFYGKSASFPVNVTLSSPVQDYNIRNAAIAAGWPGSVDTTVNITVNPGVIVGASSTGAYAMDTGSPWPASSTITVTNNGSIMGAGGAGGNGGYMNPVGPAPTLNPIGAAPTPGSPGGHALYAQRSITVVNNGTVAGGGGGGGAGGIFVQRGGYGGTSYTKGGGGGGGGQGSITSTGGSAGASSPVNPAATNISYPSPGGNGSPSSAGAQGYGYVYTPYPVAPYPALVSYPEYAVNGGAGGALGSAGSPAVPLVSRAPDGRGIWIIIDPSYGVGTTPGGSAGNYVVGSGNVTWPVAGTRLGGSA